MRNRERERENVGEISKNDKIKSVRRVFAKIWLISLFWTNVIIVCVRLQNVIMYVILMVLSEYYTSDKQGYILSS